MTTLKSQYSERSARARALRSRCNERGGSSGLDAGVSWLGPDRGRSVFGGSNGLDRSKLPRLGGNSPSPVYHGYSSIRVSSMRFTI